jgi:hypothetical protein
MRLPILMATRPGNGRCTLSKQTRSPAAVASEIGPNPPPALQKKLETFASGPQSGLLQGAKPTRLSRCPTLRGRLRFDSLCEATPCVRQVKKPHLVGIIRDRLCQHEALGAAESTLFGTHRSPAYSKNASILTRNALAPIWFRH